MEVHGSLQLQLGQDIENFAIPNGRTLPELVRPGQWFWLETDDEATRGAYMSDDTGQWLYVQHILHTGFLERIGGTMLGPLTLFRDPQLDLEAVTKQYVDNLLTNSQEDYNTVFTYDPDVGLITTSKPFVARSPRVHIGGQRLELNIDYTEVGNTQLQLMAWPTLEQIAQGDNIVVDIQVLTSLREFYNSNNLTFDPDTQRITSAQAFVYRSTRLYVGGQRLCLGSDYMEVSNNVMQLLSPLTLEQVDLGSNIILDFQPLL